MATQLIQKSSPPCSVTNLGIDDTILICQEEEIQLLFSQGRQTTRSRVLFGICLYRACRIKEAFTLSVNDVYDSKGRLRPELLIGKGNTKGGSPGLVVEIPSCKGIWNGEFGMGNPYSTSI